MEASAFIDITWTTALALFAIGFIGGLVSGFIGSGGAFVLTPAMMSLGVPGVVAVASNLCHKFPKALVGAWKRNKFGHVDVKLGIVIGVSAEAGVLVGAMIQTWIKESFGNAGSSLYVSAAFIIVLGIVGVYVLLDALRMRRQGEHAAPVDHPLARWVQSVQIPGTMVQFKSLAQPVSFLFTIPLGFATGMLAATIAVGGFIGVPGMIYLLGASPLMASATELVVAFVMGIGGTISYGLGGLVDLRLAMLILAGSLFGIQLGAIATTYVRPYMIGIVMGVIMTLVLVSRAIVVPVYLAELDLLQPLSPTLVLVLQRLSFATLGLALFAGGGIIFTAILRGWREHAAESRVAGTLALSGADDD
ncbi:MAG: sulfite exporter TauE/SafE family protein [Alphaproteobacteria bacterium]|nr:sulfite exporter TauE/SafE family protein [Alphaproteobacteria bacterium]